MVDTGNAAAWFPRGESTPDQVDDYEQMNKIAMDQKKGVYGLCDIVGP
ncbi:hypothetical protein SAMN04489740_4272 [Arthrobacter alpinus]|uniref:Uncharacterized protein n=2 Tax=Arthrobacter alpinus TaxID=656366 RepID=A0A1H5PFQ4_9MICC|nr:hypothetical protein SAMN04489740_4272 [Arthrobacter alpinus]